MPSVLSTKKCRDIIKYRLRFSITLFERAGSGEKCGSGSSIEQSIFFVENFAYFFSNEKVGRRRQMLPKLQSQNLRKNKIEKATK